MSTSLRHSGLPAGVTPFALCHLIDKIAHGTCKKERLSATTVTLLKHYIGACRTTDFEPGKICGLWEQPQTTAAELNISTKVLHNAEAELRRGGFIERTHSPQARRSGKRYAGEIVALAGISLRPLIDGYAKWQARREAMELQAKAVFCLKQEVAALNRRLHKSDDCTLIEKAGAILPRGRVSRISSVEKLEAIRDALEALLVLLELPSGDTNLPTRRKKSLHLTYLIQTHSKTVAARSGSAVPMIGRRRSRLPWSLASPVLTIEASCLRSDRQPSAN